MLVKLSDPCWWYMEVPRTGTSTTERMLRRVWPEVSAAYAKHWPVVPPAHFLQRKPLSVISVRNPYSRAVSCWQFFTRPGEITFRDWTEQRLRHGWMDVNIEARPQEFWLSLQDRWDVMLQQESLEDDFWRFVHSIDPQIRRFALPRYNGANGDWLNRVGAKMVRDRPWQAYYCPVSVRNVQELYQADFEYLADLYPLEWTE